MVTDQIRALVIDGSDRGGIARYSEMLCDELAAAGVDVRLSTAAPRRSRGAPPLPKIAWGNQVLGWSRARFYAHRLFETVLRVVALVIIVVRVRPAIVHLQTGITARFDAVLLSVLRRVSAVVVTVHDAVPFEGGDVAAGRQFDRLRRVDAVIVHTEGDVELVKRALPGVAVRLVRPAPMFRPTAVDRTEARSALGLGEEPVVLLLGLMRPYKGIDLLVQAWPAVYANRPDASLWLAGSLFDPFDELDQLLALPGVHGRLGWLEDEEMDQWAAAADVMVLPYQRGALSGVLHQAAANGTPVLVSEALAEEAVQHGLEPLPYESEAWTKAILASLVSPPAPPVLADAGTMGRETRAVYEALLAARGR
jgi:glycosyltransferase involved in cell wall biosynthesis